MEGISGMGWVDATISPPEKEGIYIVAARGPRDKFYDVTTAALINQGTHVRPEYDWKSRFDFRQMRVEWWMPMPIAPMVF